MFIKTNVCEPGKPKSCGLIDSSTGEDMVISKVFSFSVILIDTKLLLAGDVEQLFVPLEFLIGIGGKTEKKSWWVRKINK